MRLHNNLVPSAYDKNTGAEFYVFNSGDMMQQDGSRFKKRQEALQAKLGATSARGYKSMPVWKQEMSS